jgi:hypothetical protein
MLVGMAGGMRPRQRGLTLAERSGVAATERTPTGRCHCWVIGPGGERLPGLLIEWRRSGSRWEGLTVYLVASDAGEALVQGWIDADRLHRAP